MSLVGLSSVQYHTVHCAYAGFFFFFFTILEIDGNFLISLKNILHIWLPQVLVAAIEIFDKCLQHAGSLVGMWDLVPWPGIKPGPHALGSWSLSHWPTMEVLKCPYFNVYQKSIFLAFLEVIVIFSLVSLLQKPCGWKSSHRIQANFPFNISDRGSYRALSPGWKW